MENVNKTDKNTNIIQDTKQKIEVVSNGATLFERLLVICKKYSFFDIFKTLILTIFVGLMSFCFLNPTIIIDRYNEVAATKHKDELTNRFAQTRLVNSELSILLNRVGADRAFFIEYHNSVKSLQGAPFAYGSMDFEETADGVDFIGDEYTNFSLTKYKFVSYLNDNLIFYGTIDDIEPIDRRLSLKLLSNDIKYIALIEVEGTEHPLGVLGLSWMHDDGMMSRESEIKRELRSGALRLALILDNKKHEK